MLAQQTKPLEEEVEEESSEEEDEFIMVTPAGKKNPNCQVCSKPNGRYKCPKCDYRTCSAFCASHHKRLVGCDGAKAVIGFVPQREYAEKECKQDYKFLLNMMDNVDKVKKTLTGVITSPEQMRFKLLKRNAKVLYNIDIKLAPNIIERHRENISFFFLPTQQIFWVFELHYFHPSLQNCRFLTDPTCDQEPLETIFKQQFLSTQLLTQHNINTTHSNEFRILIRNTFNSISVEADKQDHIAKGKSKHQYIELDRKDKINSILKHITIHQYPTVLLLHNSLVLQFTNKNWVSLIPSPN